MDQFVCVRLVQANGLDLELFQFDYDLTFSIFFMNGDKTIYGRYGTRSSQKEAEKDISLSGLASAMEIALDLHQGYPANRTALADKQPRAVAQKIPSDFPVLNGRYNDWINYNNNVAKSCIHCHQIRDAKRQMVRAANKPLTDQLLYPHPLPATIGLEMDPDQASTVKNVQSKSPAGQAGIEPGDRILAINGAPLLSTADIQWALHTASDAPTLNLKVERENRPLNVSITLEKGWRAKSDISWRVTSWDLRRQALGGMKLDRLSSEDRKRHGIAEGKLALLAAHVGQFGEHANAKRAGIQKGDVIIGFDGVTTDKTETNIFAHVLQKPKSNQGVPVTLKRGERIIHTKINLP